MVELKYDRKVVSGSLPFFAYIPSMLLLSSLIKALSHIIATPNTTKRVVPKKFNKQ